MTILNPTPRNDWLYNDLVYYYDEIQNKIVMGKITDTIFMKGSALVYNIVGIRHCTKRFDELFDDESKAKQALSDTIDAKVEKYCNGIHTITDLLKFALEHNLRSPGVYPDNTAKRLAFVRMSKELLRVDLTR